MSMDNRAAALITKYEEEALRNAGKPYSEAVITACEVYLRVCPPMAATRIELTQPREKED